jgi:hypothetical protein
LPPKYYRLALAFVTGTVSNKDAYRNYCQKWLCMVSLDNQFNFGHTKNVVLSYSNFFIVLFIKIKKIHLITDFYHTKTKQTLK